MTDKAVIAVNLLNLVVAVTGIVWLMVGSPPHWFIAWPCGAVIAYAIHELSLG